MPGRLTERSGKQVKTVHVLGEGVTSIGRADDNMLVIASDGISRHHAEVHWDGRQYVLIDLDSKNGTWLNGQRLTSPQPLQPGDIIGFPCQPVRYLVFDVSKETVTVRPEEVFADAPDESTAALRAARRDLWVDPRTAEVWVHGRQVQVTAKEYRALSVLYASRGALISKQDLAVQVWPEYQGVVGDENIEQLISRLRRKLETDPQHPRYLLTVRGLGYRLIVV